MSWLTLVLISNAFFSVGALFDKYFCTKTFKNPLSYIVSLNVPQLIFIPILTFFYLPFFPRQFNQYIIIAVISGYVYFLTWIFWNKAIKKIEVSRASAIFNLQPIFIALLAVLFLGESLSLLKWIAVFLVVVGAYLCSLENSQKINRFNPVYLLIITCAFLSAIAGCLSKSASSSLNPIWVYLFSWFGNLPIFFLLLLKKEVKDEVKAALFNKKTLGSLFLAKGINFIAVCLFYLALPKGPISLIGAIYGTGPLFTFVYTILASLFLPKLIKESLDKSTLLYKALAILLIIIGAVIISF